MFLHESPHTQNYETKELTTVERNLRLDASILSDNAHETSALSDWAKRNGFHYLFFKELPHNHWWPEHGIGAAWALRTQRYRQDQITLFPRRAAAANAVCATIPVPVRHRHSVSANEDMGEQDEGTRATPSSQAGHSKASERYAYSCNYSSSPPLV